MNNSRIQNDKRILHLYEVLISYAPDETARKLCKHFTDSRDSTREEIIRDLVCAIADGVLWGNWPWINR